MNSDLRIGRVALREIRLELVRPFRTAAGETTYRRILLTELKDTDGTTAWGECVAFETPDYMPETVESAWEALESYVIPRVLDRSFGHPAEVSQALDRTIRGCNMAKASVEMPCWTLAAIASGQSLARFIGAERTEVVAGVVVGIGESVAATVTAVRSALDEGYPRVKLKIAPGHDVQVVEAVRDATDADVALAVDGNNAYTLEDLDILHALDAFGLQFIEQPLAWDDFTDHAELQRRMATPICLDESVRSLSDAKTMIALGSGRMLNIKPGRVGGFAEAIAIHDLCRASGVPVWCGGMLETGIGRAYNVALASLPGFTLAGDLSPSRRYWRRDIVSPEWSMDVGGSVAVPIDKPGLGVEPRMDYMEPLIVRAKDFS